MATVQAGEAAPASAAAAATPADTQQQRPRLTPEELAARGEAPVKPEFLRTATARVHVGAVAGRRLASSNGCSGGANGAPSGAPAGPGVAAAGPGENQREVRQKSKKQAKKVRMGGGGASRERRREACKRCPPGGMRCVHEPAAAHACRRALASHNFLPGPPAAPCAPQERSQQRYSTSELCTMFALGKCPYGGDCRWVLQSCPGMVARCLVSVRCMRAVAHARY